MLPILYYAYYDKMPRRHYYADAAAMPYILYAITLRCAIIFSLMLSASITPPLRHIAAATDYMPCRYATPLRHIDVTIYRLPPLITLRCRHDTWFHIIAAYYFDSDAIITTIDSHCCIITPLLIAIIWLYYHWYYALLLMACRHIRFRDITPAIYASPAISLLLRCHIFSFSLSLLTSRRRPPDRLPVGHFLTSHITCVVGDTFTVTITTSYFITPPPLSHCLPLRHWCHCRRYAIAYETLRYCYAAITPCHCHTPCHYWLMTLIGLLYITRHADAAAIIFSILRHCFTDAMLLRHTPWDIRRRHEDAADIILFRRHFVAILRWLRYWPCRQLLSLITLIDTPPHGDVAASAMLPLRCWHAETLRWWCQRQPFRADTPVARYELRAISISLRDLLAFSDCHNFSPPYRHIQIFAFAATAAASFRWHVTVTTTLFSR